MHTPEFERGVQKRLICLLVNLGEIVDECYDEGYKFWYGWFVVIGAILPIFSVGVLVLSCNERNCDRWRLIFSECCNLDRRYNIICV